MITYGYLTTQNISDLNVKSTGAVGLPICDFLLVFKRNIRPNLASLRYKTSNSE